MSPHRAPIGDDGWMGDSKSKSLHDMTYSRVPCRRLVGWLVGSLVGWFVGWLVRWLVGLVCLQAVPTGRVRGISQTKALCNPE